MDADRLIDTAIFMLPILAVFAILIFWVRSREKQDWNEGCCPQCGDEWRHFDCDSQGGRGYCCDKCDTTIWISYRVDRRGNNRSKLPQRTV